MILAELDQMLKAVCPIHGVDSDGNISFSENATPQQISDANALIVVNLPLLDGVPKNAAILAQIESVKSKFTDTIQMEAISGDLVAKATVESLTQQLLALKAQLIP